MQKNKYQLVLCQFYDERYHGKNIFMEGNILCEYIYKSPFKYVTTYSSNVYYRNFRNNILNNTVNKNEVINILPPQIAQVNRLESGECVCVLKTFWFRIFLRIWKAFVVVAKAKRNIHYLLRRERGKH